MKVAIVGYKKSFLEKAMKKEGFFITNHDPDAVVSFGGDGTFLYSENLFPGIPKLFIKHYSVCNKCKDHDYKKVLDYLTKKKFKIVEYSKIVASVNNKILYSMNDISIHYNPPRAVRFDVKVNNKKIAKNVIGDGIVVSTPYGSSGYFSSITRRTFEKGIGLAFNNPVKKIKEKIISENSKIEIKITRGPGIMCSDCNAYLINLKSGDRIKIKKHNQVARILTLKGKTKVIV